MAEFKVRLTRTERFTVFVLGAFLVVEFVVLMSLVHFARFPLFIPLFIRTLKILTPAFIVLNAAFLISIMLVRGRKLIVRSWKDYVRELMRFAVISLMLTIILMTISALIGALLGLVADEMSKNPAAGGVLQRLRDWVSQNIY
jgi:hypothetical protein